MMLAGVDGLGTAGRQVEIDRNDSPPREEPAMPDKSPQRPTGQKPAKTLKDKRGANRAKQQTKRSLTG